MQDVPNASDILQDMLGCILNNECEKLERLLMENVNEINNPIGMPFELPNHRFLNHPALSQMVIIQHPLQTILDVACGMPNGPVVWVLLSYGAKSSIHPLGIDLALHNAIKNGRSYTVQALLIPGRSEVNGTSEKGWKPLLQAVLWTGPEVVSILLKRGARVDESGPSPISPGIHTALQLCLERRACEYGDEVVRSKCNEILKLLLNAGASIHVPPPEGSPFSPFEKLIEPWNKRDHWSMRLSSAEMDCLGKFVEEGAHLTAEFLGSPCAASSSNTFVHQAIWHSPPRVSHKVVDSISTTAPTNGAVMLHEVVGICPDAKRHLSDTLQDIQSLLKKRIDPNVLDNLGMTPLRKCIDQSSNTDVAAITQKLLDHGADPEYQDTDGVQPYTVAALTLREPVRTEVLQAMLANMHGHYTRSREGVSYTWKTGLFPIPDVPTHQQVLSCTRPDDEFQVSMREMVPVDVQPAFQRAYLAIISHRLFHAITKEAATRAVREKDRWDLLSILSLRGKANLPKHQFDQGLIVALLGFPKISAIEFGSASSTATQVDGSHPSEATASSELPHLDSPIPDATLAYPPFRLNTNSSLTPVLSSRLSQESDTSHDAFVGDTTQIRWLDPEAKRAPVDTVTAAANVLQYKCATCADGRLLTKTELQKHEVEHAHTTECDGVGCTRRFCKETRKREAKDIGCQDHLFPMEA